MNITALTEPFSFWPKPLTLQRSNFVHKSLSDWNANVAVGCGHGCRFCYVPKVINRGNIKEMIRSAGVEDADLNWGDYALLRQWDRTHWQARIKAEDAKPLNLLSKDGNRAVMFCTTTDLYQVMRHKDPARQKELQAHLWKMATEALEDLLEHTTLNVRILTRSPLARKHFDLYRRFGNRLMFGMSLPTLNNQLAKIYEPDAPSPSKRLETLKAAKQAGLNVYVAVAPVYPECDQDDMRETLQAVKELDPETIFMEPINIRGENVTLIREAAKKLGIEPKSHVFADTETWSRYAIDQLHAFENLALELGVLPRLHLWPDQALKKRVAGVNQYWNRVSEWPGKTVASPGSR